MHEITYLWYGGTTDFTYTDPFSSSPSQIVDNKEKGKEELEPIDCDASIASVL